MSTNEIPTANAILINNNTANATLINNNHENNRNNNNENNNKNENNNEIAHIIINVLVLLFFTYTVKPQSTCTVLASSFLLGLFVPNFLTTALINLLTIYYIVKLLTYLFF